MSRKKVKHTRRGRYRLLYNLEAWLETPMFLLALLWLGLLVKELAGGLTAGQQRLVFAIWLIFIFEFLLKLFLAPDRLSYVKRNWITVIALVVPAFRAFRLLRALRILRVSRVTSTTNVVRSLTSANRFFKALKQAQGPRPEAEMNVGIMVAYSRSADKNELQAFAENLVSDTSEEMRNATNMKWHFHYSEPEALDSDNARMPSDFLDDASLRMAEGPYDLVVVITDVALMSRKRRVEPGLASPVSRTLIISTRKLTTATRGKAARKLYSEDVRWNGAALLLHLLGRISGLHDKSRRESNVMAPFTFINGRKNLPHFNEKEKKILRKRVERLPERELHGGNVLETFIFHILMTLRHPGDVIRPLVRNWAPLLPLSLPGLATAAVAPSFLLIFTAEIWDVGLNMSNHIAFIYAVVSVLAAAFYLVKVQSLFFPRKEKRVLTEHLAVANSVVFLSVLLACIGLFIMVGALMLLLEVYIFPAGLMKTWPTLEDPEIVIGDKIRLAAFISTVGVTTGALAGGMESRTVIRHLALFLAKP